MSKKSPSDASIIWDRIHFHFQFQPDKVREFYTGAMKFLLPKPAWDDSFPATKPSLDGHEAVAAFARGFNEQNLIRMTGRPDDLDELMRLAAIGKTSPGAKRDRRWRLKRINVLREHMRKCLKLYHVSEQPLQGMTFATVTVRRHYFPEAPPQQFRQSA